MVESVIDNPLADGADTPQQISLLRRWLRWGWRTFAVVLLFVLVAALVAWFSRKEIADNIIGDQLTELGLPATYEIKEIGPRRQELRNIVVGDPAAPDLTIERAVVDITPRWGIPAIGRITIVEPRLYGSYRGEKLSFGSLDPVIFTDSEEPFRLPDLDIAVIDGRGQLVSDFGTVGFKADGEGRLRSGFTGELAVVGPALSGKGCAARGASLYGRVIITAETPRFSGPLRLANLECAGQKLALGKTDAMLDLVLDQQLDGVEGGLSLNSEGATQGANRLGALTGESRFVFRDNDLTASLSLASANGSMPGIAADQLAVGGTLRARDGFAALDFDGDVTAGRLKPGADLDGQLAGFERQAQGSFIAPLLARARRGLAAEQRGGRADAQLSYRQTGDLWSVVIPRANWRGSSGATLLAASALQARGGGSRAVQFAGNFITGGRDLPRITGRAERRGPGEDIIRLSMADYSAGDARLALPQLTIVSRASGVLGFSGMVEASGALPGGAVRDLVLPVDGNWSAARGLVMLDRCTPVRFASLSYSNLTLDRQALTVCPPGGGAIVRSNASGMSVAGGVDKLNLTGKVGDTPLRITSGGFGLAWPGNMVARDVKIALGPSGEATTLDIERLQGVLGQTMAGQFANASARLPAVPLDLDEINGNWRYADGRLQLADVALKVSDRVDPSWRNDPLAQDPSRFVPVTATGATLLFADGMITSDAMLLNPATQRNLAQVLIRHDLASSTGGADLIVSGITFDKQLQPEMLTGLTKGVVALADGTMRGRGRIDWNAGGVTSSGSFTTDNLDFAAAFGPVKGLSGTINFDDLLALRTAPDQIARVTEINPGIPVNDGVIRYRLLDDFKMQIDGGEWPFVGGRLLLEPALLDMANPVERRLTMRIEGMDAARFLQRLELANISATGIFDGKLPMMFDENGGRIEGGVLIARPPGGTLAYVGELTYEDLSPMGNFAFQALRALKFDQLSVLMDGDIAGELVTKVQFTGVGQGEGTRQNFITRRIARLPIQFNVNIRAPFYQLITTTRSLYDPTYIPDPRDLGLVPGGPAIPGGAQTAPAQPVQPQESEDKP